MYGIPPAGGDSITRSPTPTAVMLPIMMTHAHHGALAHIRLMVSMRATIPYPTVWCTARQRQI